jgi:hypothetical protein
MSFLYQLQCPRCNRPTTLSLTGTCINRLKNRESCGYSFTWIDPETRNSTQREKEVKHSSPPSVYPVNDTVSWCDGPVTYQKYQTGIALTGSIHFDSKWNYLFLWDTPNGSAPVGTMLYASGCEFYDVSGVKMPLNSKPNNLHIHFDNYQSHLIKVCDYSSDLTIQFPSFGNSSEFNILSSGNSIFTFNPQTSGYHFDS